MIFAIYISTCFSLCRLSAGWEARSTCHSCGIAKSPKSCRANVQFVIHAFLKRYRLWLCSNCRECVAEAEGVCVCECACGCVCGWVWVRWLQMRLAAVAIERDGAGTQRDRERGREGEREKGGEMASNASTELVITARWILINAHIHIEREEEREWEWDSQRDKLFLGFVYFCPWSFSWTELSWTELSWSEERACVLNCSGIDGVALRAHNRIVMMCSSAANSSSDSSGSSGSGINSGNSRS